MIVPAPGLVAEKCWPVPLRRLPVRDHGVVMRSGGGPGPCDELGARDVWVWEYRGTYYMHYDGAGPKGRLVCLATSKDLVHWKKHRAVLDLGPPGAGFLSADIPLLGVGEKRTPTFYHQHGD